MNTTPRSLHSTEHSLLVSPPSLTASLSLSLDPYFRVCRKHDRMPMTVPDFLPGQAAAELLKVLVQISGKSMICRSQAEQLKQTIEELFPIIQEVKYSGVELPANRQFQLSLVSEELRSGLDLCHKVICLPPSNFLHSLLN